MAFRLKKILSSRSAGSPRGTLLLRSTASDPTLMEWRTL